MLFVACWMPASPSIAADASAVCRLTIPKLVDGRYDLEVLLFHRDGAFHNGYARVLGRDQLPQSVDITPSRPIQWQTADGKPIDVPDKMRGYYSYTNKEEFAAWKKRYETGQIKIGYPIDTPPIAWDGARLIGVVDVLIKPMDRANTPGREGVDVPYRISIDAKGSGDGKLAGTYTLWTYADKDDTYGQNNPKTKGDLVNARWDSAYWKPADGTEYAAGKDWPQARGPNLTGAATDSQRPLIDNLHDARLLWVSEEILPGGRGAVLSRGGFAMYPYAWQNIGFGGFSGPAVVDGKVYQYLTIADEALVARDEAIARNVYVQLGADPRTMGNERGHMRDTVLCLDAQTGKTLWWWKSEKTFGNVPEGKGGVGTTTCVFDGKVYARGSGGLYCLDAQTGKLLWNVGGSKKDKVSFGLSGNWSHDMSPVMIGGVLVMTHGNDGSLAGVNPQNGEVLWSHPKAGGYQAVPTKVVVDGKEHVIVGSGLTQQLSLIEPATGKILWTSDALGSNAATLSVWDTIVCGNAIKAGDDKPDNDKAPRKAGAVQVGTDKAQRLWQSDEAGYPPHRSVPVAHKGHFYIDTRDGFWCLDAATGKIVNRHPHIYKMTGGSHNWVWTIASNDRIFTSGLLMFSTADGGFSRMPGRLSLPLADGYMCPIKPAIADGRLFARLGDKLVCYDLRKDPNRKSQTIELQASNALGSSMQPQNPVDLRVRIVADKVERIYANWPEIVGPEAAKVNNWAAGYGRPLAWPSYPAEDLSLSKTGLSGSARVPLGWHHENWTFDLQRSGDSFTGRFVRSLPAIANPLKVSGKLTGKLEPLSDGTLYVLSLESAASQFKPDGAAKPLTVALVKNGSAVRGWAAGINSILHEIDPSTLAITDNAIKGKLTVIFRDDEHFHLNAADASAVAGTYDIQATITDAAIDGQHQGTLGEAWSRTGTISGKIAPQ